MVVERRLVMSSSHDEIATGETAFKKRKSSEAKTDDLFGGIDLGISSMPSEIAEDNNTLLDVGDEELDSFSMVGSHGIPIGGQASEHGSWNVVTDFSMTFPDVSPDDSQVELHAAYNSDKVVTAAWNRTQSQEVKQLWESNFWERFLDPNVTAFDMFSRGTNRPIQPNPEQLELTGENVENRKISQPAKQLQSFLSFVRNVDEINWREERESVWQTAIRRWVAMLDRWFSGESTLLKALAEKTTFTEKAQILVDVFYNKAPQTLMKRVNSLSAITQILLDKDLTFPCSEEEFYALLKDQAAENAPATRLKGFMEAVVFARHILSMSELQPIIDSRRCYGAALKQVPTSPRQADPFTVKQLRQIHCVLETSDELWQKAMAGMILFCTYARSRWSDAQHAESLIEDRDDSGELQSLESRTTVHKTARALQMRHMFLPMSAPAKGVTDECWAQSWLEVRVQLGIDDMKIFPLMPAPDRNLEPTKRALSTSEAKGWIAHILGDAVVSHDAKLTTHSCKSTLLSYLAKRGISMEDRLVLGYHSNKLRVGLTYSRDSAARPLALLNHVLHEIRLGVFEPDNSRSGRLHPDARNLDEQIFQRSGETLGNAVETSVEQSEKTQIKGEQTSVECIDLESDEDGHVTTSSSSEDESLPLVSPVVGHYKVQIPENMKVWKNHSTKVFHLSNAEHSHYLVCGRKIVSHIKQHEAEIRFDAAKCKQCFRNIRG